MLSSFLALGITLLLAYIWLTRGFYSALIHLICTIIAGAIAFAAWEPLSVWFLEYAQTTGGLDSVIGGAAWSLGLALPFAGSLVVLRLITNIVLRANVAAPAGVNYAGGAVCGAAAGVITAGVFMLAGGFLRLDREFFTGAPLAWSANGSIVRETSGFFPADKLTSKFYGALSERAFNTIEPLARYHPDLWEAGPSMRFSYQNGENRNTTRPSDYKVTRRFTINAEGTAKLDDILKDKWYPEKAQSVSDLDGNPFPPGSRIEGYTVNFTAGAKESSGQVTISNGQVRLVCEDQNSDRVTLFPVAVSSQADSAKPQLVRWRFDAREVFISSTGGAAEAEFRFEFVVPPGYNPIALYVKGSRTTVGEIYSDGSWGSKITDSTAFDSAAQRDAWIDPENLSGPVVAQSTGPNKVTVAKGPVPVDGFKMSNRFGFTLQDGTFDGFDLIEDGKVKVVTGGEIKIPIASTGLNPDKALRVEQFAAASDVVICMVDVSMKSKMSLLGGAAASVDKLLPPVLTDSQGQIYQPVGFIYRDESICHMKYDPGNPIRALAEIPTLTSSRPAQKLTLIFRVSKGVTVTNFSIGPKVIAEYEPGIEMTEQQTNR